MKTSFYNLISGHEITRTLENSKPTIPLEGSKLPTTTYRYRVLAAAHLKSIQNSPPPISFRLSQTTYQE